MKSGRTSSEVYTQLAQRLRKLVADEHHNNLTGAERFTVLNVTPLTLEQLQGDLILEEGDPDFTIGAWLRQYLLKYTLTPGALVWCIREGQEWHALDLADPGGQSAWS